MQQPMFDYPLPRSFKNSEKLSYMQENDWFGEYDLANKQKVGRGREIKEMSIIEGYMNIDNWAGARRTI